MSRSHEDPVFARRALALALSHYLDGGRVIQAVALWSGEFEGRGSLFVGLNRYCRQVAQAFGLQGKEAELHLSIFRALQAKGAVLPADPLALRDEFRPAAMAGSGSVVEAFFAAVEASLGPARLPELRRRLLVHARSLPPPLQLRVAAWWSGAASALPGEWPAGGSGTRVVNIIYVALAECLGPTKADQVFTDAVRQLERSPHEALRDIRRYL